MAASDDALGDELIDGGVGGRDRDAHGIVHQGQGMQEAQAALVGDHRDWRPGNGGRQA